MAKPKPKQKPQQPVQTSTPGSTHPRARRVRVVKNGAGDYDVFEDVYECPPTSSKLLKKGVDHGTAQYEVRLYLENFLGPDRVADTGL